MQIPSTAEMDAIETMRMLGVSATDQHIVETLRKYNGDVEKTASDLLSALDGPGSNNENDDMPGLVSFADEQWQPNGALNSRAGAPPPTPRAPSNQLPEMIDLTGEDDEEEQLRKALDLSLNSTSTSTAITSTSTALRPLSRRPSVPDIVFGPSERVDANQNWAMVPSSQQKLASQGEAKDSVDADLRRAVEASMNDNSVVTRLDVKERPRGEFCLAKFKPEYESISEWAEPLALYCSDKRVAYAPALLQALFAIPQLRQSFKSIQIPDGFDGTDFFKFSSLQRLFTAMEHCQATPCDITGLLIECNVPTDPGFGEGPVDASLNYFKELKALVERVVGKLSSLDRGHSDSPVVATSISSASPLLSNPSSVLQCPISTKPSRNDLYTCIDFNLQTRRQMLAQLRGPHSDIPIEVYSKDTGMIVIPIVRDWPTGSTTGDSYGPTELSLDVQVERALEPSPSPNNVTTRTSNSNARELFVFPATLHMDRWVEDNKVIMQERDQEVERLESSIKENLRRLAVLNGTKEKPNLAILKSTLHYIENVASGDTAQRKARHVIAAKKVRSIIAVLEDQIRQTMDDIRADMELRNQIRRPEVDGDPQYKFELRAVLMYDGQYGPKNTYSYCKAFDGSWWKLMGDEITEVSEEAVLGDRTGLYLNAGAYMLFYSSSAPSNIDQSASLPKVPETDTIPAIRTTPSWPLQHLAEVAQSNENFRQQYISSRDPDSRNSNAMPSLKDLEQMDALTQHPLLAMSKEAGERIVLGDGPPDIVMSHDERGSQGDDDDDLDDKMDEAFLTPGTSAPPSATVSDDGSVV